MASLLQIGPELELKIHRAHGDVRATINAQYRWLEETGRLGNGLTYEENVRDAEIKRQQSVYWALTR